MLCLIYHRSFDSVVAIYYSKWFIKRLNNIESDKKKQQPKNRYFRVFKSQFSDGDLTIPNTGPQ